MIIERRSSTKKFQILIYLFITYLFSWTAWGILYTSYKNVISRNIYYNHFQLFLVIGGSMPSIMSIIFVSFFYGSNGIKEILKKLITWKVNPLFYLFALFYTVLSFYIPLWICNITGSTYKFYCPISIYNILLYFLSTMFLGGPIEEELGWRGYVLPQLQNKFNPVYSSVVLGIFWACWHIPLFFIRGMNQYGASFILFIIEVILSSILFTWVYNRTHGSLIISILFHASFNVTVSILYPLHYFLKSVNRYTIIAVIIQFIFFLFIILDMIRKPKSKSIIKNYTTL
jgi:membrane protease YdiL (CAAX protease family)